MLPRPKRRKRPKMGVKNEEVIRCPSHLAFIRRHECALAKVELVEKYQCQGPVEAAHVRTATNGSMGKKPGDNYAIPLCSFHHRLQHREGEMSFQILTGLKMKEVADYMWFISDARKRYEAKKNDPNR